jgi:hypothetical protein
MKKVIFNLWLVIALLLQQPLYACFSAPRECTKEELDRYNERKFFCKVAFVSTVCVASAVGVNMLLANLTNALSDKRPWQALYVRNKNTGFLPPSAPLFSFDGSDIFFSLLLGPIFTWVFFSAVKKTNKAIRKKVNEIKKKG